MNNDQLLTDESIIDELLDINIPGIADAITEIFGERHNDKIEERLNRTIFVACGSDKEVMEFVLKRIESLKNWLQTLPVDQRPDYEDVLYEKISKLETIYKIVEEKQKEIEKVDALSETFIKDKIEYCENNLSEKTKARLDPKTRSDLHSFIRGGFGLADSSHASKVMEYYNNVFKKLLRCSIFNKLEDNEDYRLICQCSADAYHILNRQENTKYVNSITTQASIKRLRAAGIGNNMTDDVIRIRYLTRPDNLKILGDTGVEQNDNGDVCNIVNLRLCEYSNDHTIIHELIHVISSDIIKKLINTIYLYGFYNCDCREGYRYFNEIVTDWLAEIVTKIYSSKYMPMMDHILYPSAYKASCALLLNFLENYKEEIINAIMSDHPIEFLEKIGLEICSKVDHILSETIQTGKISKEDDKLLYNFNNLEKQVG